MTRATFTIRGSNCASVMSASIPPIRIKTPILADRFDFSLLSEIRSSFSNVPLVFLRIVALDVCGFLDESAVPPAASCESP